MKVKIMLYIVLLGFFILQCSSDTLIKSGYGGEILVEAGLLDHDRILYSSTYEEKLKEAEERKKELSEAKWATQKKKEELKEKVNDLLAYIEELDKQLNEIMLEIDKLNLDITLKEEELAETRRLLEEAKELEAIQYDTMQKRIQYMYENDSTGVLDIIMNAKSISELLNQVEYFSKITEYDNNLLVRYTETKLLIADKEACLELDIDTLNELKEATAFQQATIISLSDEKGKSLNEYMIAYDVTDELLSEYLGEIVKQDKAIEEIKAEEEERIRREEEERKKEEERLRKLEEERLRKEREETERLEKLAEQERIAALENIKQSDATSVGEMIWPLPGDGRTFAGFGYRVAPTQGASTYHRGVDIGGEYGAEIVAALAGTVETVSYSVTAGNYVIIYHGDGIRTAYLHCSKQLVSVGEYVKQGTIIALVGSTGVSTGPHLHFGVSVNGTYVDPMNYISYK